MNYISLIDELGIDINTITTLDATKIIRLQKQLKAKAVLNNQSNLGELAALIDNLKDENVRKHHVFVENHKWLKQIISGDYSNIPQNSVSVNLDLITDAEDTKHFLSPYFKEHIKPFLSETLSKGKYLLLINFVKSNILFSEEIEQIIINFFISKLNYAKVYIEEGKLKDKHYPVAYITNRNFIKCLSQYPSSFDDEINELNSEVIDTYNAKRKNVNNDIFIFAARTMVAFGELEISNYMLKDVLLSNAEIAKSYAYNTGSKSKSGAGVGVWSIIIFVVLIIRIGTTFFKNSSNSYDSNYNLEKYRINNSVYENEDIMEAIRRIQEQQEANNNNNLTSTDDVEFEIEETVIESTEPAEPESNKITLPDRGNRLKQSDHIRFIYTLKLKTNRDEENLGSSNSVELNDFTNPFPKTFNLLNTSKTRLNNTNYRLVKNNSNKDLIVFRFTSGIDEAVFIPKDETIYVNLRQGDSIIFYTGQRFTVDRLSHFKENAELSKLYLIENFIGSTNQEINVLPFKVSSYKSKKLNSDIETIKETKTDVIKTKNINLRGINIDKIYINWYKKKYN
ncbi:hypothetical protein [Olleya sp. YS]|uniref:hypothetical protein n=1 Tax=Olleya sp. YS TaxID=3028318 RepID=UPI0024345E5A|nr:hypothetical protein [Olleya sp. YS]WGD35233.1 hypothetical protein Ollyesu_02190 [Olleya sp. YS]